MKTLMIGDMHLKQEFVLPCVDDALAADGEIQRVIFLGDSCDDWSASEGQALRALGFFADWTEAHRARRLAVDVLLGNHDFCYIRSRRGPGTLAGIIRDIRTILEDRLHARLATAAGPYLCSHAGLTSAWAAACPMEAGTPETLAHRLNEMLEDGFCWSTIDSCPPSRGGASLPGPLWADLHDLLADPLEGIGQIVGHTPVATAAHYPVATSFETATPSDSSEIWACDTLSLSSIGTPLGDGSMLVMDENGTVRPLAFPSHDGYAAVAARYWQER